ncbi:MAG: site-2 protease family protein [Thermodesulfobacteriota bacterium]
MEKIIQDIAILAVPILMAITFHEFAHGWMADRLGDPTPRSMGRLTLNPIKHLDPIGTIVFLMTRMIGWAKPVPVNPFNLKDPKKGMLWIALAGPAINLTLAFISAIIYRTMLSFPLPFLYSASFITLPLLLMLKASVVINTALGLFNLIPLPPLDGGRIMTGLLPQEKAIAFSRIEPYGPIILIALIFTNVLDSTLFPIIHSTIGIFLGL